MPKPTEKQRAAIRAVFESNDKLKRSRPKSIEDEIYQENGNIEYLGERELREIKGYLERGGYERLG